MASLTCRRSAPSTTLAISCDTGWTSILLDHNWVAADEQTFEIGPTPDQTIVVVTRGEQEIESFTGGVWRHAIYRAGSVGMTPGGTTDRLRRRLKNKAATVEKVNLYIPQSFFREAADHYRQAGQTVREEPLAALAFHDPLIAHTVLALLRAMAASAPDLYAQIAMQWLAAHLLSVHSPWLAVEGDRRNAGVISDQRLARVLDYMSAHLAEPLTLEALAAEAAISKFHFARLFRESVGATPHAFLVQLRMEAARRMLTTTDLTVASIAVNCGFVGPAHFGTAFTRRYGLSPKAFRVMARGA